MANQIGHIKDSDEFASWVRKWADRITQFAHSYTGNWTAAEDIAQETFLRLYQHCERGKPVHPGWLFTVAHNLAMDYRRRPRDTSLPESLPVSSKPVDRQVIVRDVLDHMPARDREVLWLFYYADHSMADVAQALGIPLSQVKTRLYRARERFRKIWEDDRD